MKHTMTERYTVHRWNGINCKNMGVLRALVALVNFWQPAKSQLPISLNKLLKVRNYVECATANTIFSYFIEQPLKMFRKNTFFALK